MGTLRSSQTESLSGATVVVLGVGNIGLRVARLCKAFEMTVHGVTRSAVTSGQGSPHVNVYWTSEEMEMALAEADVIVSCLPSSQQTVSLLDNDRSRWISKAVLDVFSVEPLPADSPLWKEPNVIITPHVAMDCNTHTKSQIVRHFLDNYKRFVNNEPLMDFLDCSRDCQDPYWLVVGGVGGVSEDLYG
ncbi:hypothetical protein C0Q70_04245 [Pomacea canaliculata]|uniref:D-isomer specific 2-hydroxyacid dehydrogenase NAD-binding domain-containing protein n=1 Tax=Pomacea canaliculata TaxID=400727 RepID=A0A2T7PV05_POMCA|nr:hypothetical protein C0Q70_04245 [Pomacea canaliculata]